jgi:Tfp pilus assembly major pilin PilA
MEGRTCTKCGEFKLAVEFGNKRWTRKDGTVVEILKSRCHPCRAAAEKERNNATPENRAHYSKRVSDARKKRLANMTPEQREAYQKKASGWAKAWKLANPDKVFEMKKKHRETHKEYIKTKKANDAKTPHGRELDRARTSRYYKTHTERLLARCREARAELPDWYVKAILRLPQGIEIPKGLVEIKREVVKIKRELEKTK